MLQEVDRLLQSGHKILPGSVIADIVHKRLTERNAELKKELLDFMKWYKGDLPESNGKLVEKYMIQYNSEKE